jgi:hypothetical protein
MHGLPTGSRSYHSSSPLLTVRDAGAEGSSNNAATPHLASGAAACCAQVMMVTYLCCVRAHELGRGPQHLRCRQLSFAEVQTLRRYTLRWHDLQVQRGCCDGVHRSRRVCMHQASGGRQAAGWACQGSPHFLLQCPVLQHVRDMSMPGCISGWLHQWA